MATNEPRSEHKPNILVVGPEDVDLAVLRQLFEAQRWPFLSVRTLAGASTVMARNRPALLLCDAHLDDGDWKCMLPAGATTVLHSPLLIVTSSQADDNLWAEVLNLGGYDVLAKPYDPNEVIRVVGIAWERVSCAHRKFVGAERGIGRSPTT
jgi:DNA-binding NtrC family response regulator